MNGSVKCKRSFIAKLWLSVAALTVSAVTAWAGDVKPLVIGVTDTYVAVSHVTNGNKVVLMTAAMANQDGLLRQQVGVGAFDTVSGSYQYNGVIPLRSEWVAFDVATARYIIGARADYTPQVQTLADTKLHSDGQGVVEFVNIDQMSALVVVVRQNQGAWYVQAAQGGPGDASSPPSGQLNILVSSLAPVPGITTAPPSHLVTGDIVVLIDPTTLLISTKVLA